MKKRKIQKIIKKVANFTPLRFVIDIVNIIGAVSTAGMMFFFIPVILLLNEQAIEFVSGIFLICGLTYFISEVLIKGLGYANKNW